MASSQLEISSPSSPFGCVLRDHNRRDAFRDTNVSATQVAFHKNLKTLVMDRLNDCISITPNHNCENRNLNNAPALPNFRVPRSNRINDNTANANASSVMSPRRSCILDRWAAKQLHQTLSTIDHQHNNHGPHQPSNQDSSAIEPSAPSKEETVPLPETGSDKETSKLGASSLVQMWEKRLNVSNGSNSNTQNASATVSSGRQVSELVNTEQACSVEAVDFEDERYDAGPGSEDCFADWHSNRTSSSSPPCSTQSQSSDAGERESERVRVVDIIRRLTAANQTQSTHPSWVEENEHSNEPPYPSLREQVEHRCLSQLICSPRIRGRQAFADLLMQMERERQRELDKLMERRAVSKFGQRGRIQSLLRLRILKRGMAVEDEQQRSQFRGNQRSTQGSSTIMHLRERFSRAGENGSRSPLGGETLNNNTNNDDDKTQSDTDCPATYTNYNQQAVGAIEHTVDHNPIPGDVKKQEIKEEVATSTAHATSQDTPNLNSQQDSTSAWEDNEVAEDNYGADDAGTSYDWFIDISRPRSYWEDRRQTWYQQMLESNSANDEIRQLIQRKTVSNFLSSDFRERMDQLMVCRLERQTQQQEEYDDNEDDGAEEELWCFSEGHTQPKNSDDDEEEEEEEEDEDEDEASLIGAQYHEASDYLDQSASPLQLASPSILSSWSYQDNEMGEDSNRAASTSSPQPFPTHQLSSNQQCSLVSRSHPSIEMELIYDLRGHMEQLYQEMSELRKSIKCCMDMQLMLQQSIKHEVVAGGGGRKSNKEKSRERKCCICCEMQIDSLLYRCGHMCSCMKCGKELQWNGGKCPVCGAPIEDVVRASYTP